MARCVCNSCCCIICCIFAIIRSPDIGCLTAATSPTEAKPVFATTVAYRGDEGVLEGADGGGDAPTVLPTFFNTLTTVFSKRFSRFSSATKKSPRRGFFLFAADDDTADPADAWPCLGFVAVDPGRLAFPCCLEATFLRPMWCQPWQLLTLLG